MKINKKIIAGFVATSALALGISSAMAQPSGDCSMAGGRGMMMQDGKGGMRGDPAAMVGQHLDKFKSELKITAEQEPLWTAFSEKVKDQAGKGMKAMRDQQVDEKLTAPERMSRMNTLMKERLAAMEGVTDSFKRLYDALTPEQKAVADKHAAAMGHRMGANRGGKGMRQGGPGRPAKGAAPAPDVKG
jgi:periplasmic protein CpxP/Spy